MTFDRQYEMYKYAIMLKTYCSQRAVLEIDSLLVKPFVFHDYFS
jgi:hypothetical protein